MENFDTIVVGAGPAGSTAAAYLAKAGKNVLLIDKASFPRDKVCGDALSGKTMKVIRELNLVEEIKKLPHASIRGVLFSSPSGHILKVPFVKSDQNREDGVGYCMRRYHTDNMFFNAAKRFGAKTKEKMLLQNLIFENNKVVGIVALDLNTQEKKEFYAPVIIGADGVNSIVAREVLKQDSNLDSYHSCDAIRQYFSSIKGLSDYIEIHFLDSVQPGYFWIFPLENGTANVGLGLVSAELQKKMKNSKTTLISLFQQAIRENKLLKDRFIEAKALGPITGWRLPFGSKKRKVAGNGWVLVGDAASLVDPFSGEGVGNATISAKLAAQTIIQALEAKDFSEQFLAQYEQMLWQELGPELDTSYKMQQIGKIKFLLDRVIYKAATDEKIRETIANSLASEETKKELLNPLFYLKILL
ncbi:MAG: geranylgeranyl reductase family protein [Candidatus Micrarchaeota archaeon]|nr:geranylgeranyl reductase family protein [Candidatus Micrarchaeota archaeon]